MSENPLWIKFGKEKKEELRQDTTGITQEKKKNFNGQHYIQIFSAISCSAKPHHLSHYIHVLNLNFIHFMDCLYLICKFALALSLYGSYKHEVFISSLTFRWIYITM